MTKTQYGGVIENGIYKEFYVESEAIEYIKVYFYGLEKKILRVGDVHKVADYGAGLVEGYRRKRWRQFVRERFDFLLSYIGSSTGKVFDSLISLSKELELTIWVSYRRGKGETKNMYVEWGSKAWFMKMFATTCPETRLYLLDDGEDHVASVNSLHNVRIKGLLVDYRTPSGRDVYRELSEDKREYIIAKVLDKIDGVV